MLFKKGQIFFSHLNLNAITFPLLLSIIWILSTSLNINKEIATTIFLHGCPVITWVGCIWIILTCCQHTTNLIFRINLMGQLGRHSRSYQFMVSCLVFNLFLILTLFKAESCSHKWCMENHIDFIECEPVLNQTFITCEKGTAKIFIETKHLTVTPATILCNQVHGTIKVCDCHQRLNAILVTFFEEVLVKGKPSFIWLSLITLRKNT